MKLLLQQRPNGKVTVRAAPKIGYEVINEISDDYTVVVEFTDTVTGKRALDVVHRSQLEDVSYMRRRAQRLLGGDDEAQTTEDPGTR